MGNSAGNGSPFLCLVCVLGIIKNIYIFYYSVAQCHVNRKENEKKREVCLVSGVTGHKEKKRWVVEKKKKKKKTSF